MQTLPQRKETAMKTRNIRILVAWVLILLLSVSLIACNNDGDTTSPTDAPTSVPTEAPTNEPTEAPTSEPTEPATSEPTEPVTEKPTEPATEKPTEPVTEKPTEPVTEKPTEPVTEKPTEPVTEKPTEPATEKPTEAPTEEPTDAPPPERNDPTDPKVDTSAEHIVDQSQWVATDGLNRVLSTNTDTGDIRDGKIVAIFYWSWHGEFADSYKAYNNQENIDKLIEMGYTERDYMNMSIEQLNALGIQTEMGPYHFWDEPVYGYYDGDDEWVIRKQAELLAAADIDVVFFDNTNGTFTWMETAMKVMKVFSEARAEGVDAPAVSFMLPFGPIEATRIQLIKLYDNIYSQNYCSDVWFRLDEKPMIMGWNMIFDLNDAKQNAIYNFFDFRANVAGYLDTESAPNQWGWLSRFPQAYFHNSDGIVEQITVGTAVNHDYVNSVLAPMSLGQNIIGRTWTSHGYDTRKDAVLFGACLSEQWENALAVDPEVVFVTAWNEWVAMRIEHWPAGEGNDYYNCFVDQYNAEFSRDCEPSNGILKDHYYYQLADYVRQFKGTNPIEAASKEKSIDIFGDYAQWSNVGPLYNDYFGLPDRDHKGYIDPATGQPLYYTNYTGRNDFYDTKVARDGENIYFMVRTVDDITPYTDAYWMRLYIDMGATDVSWENYEFILNKQNPDNENTATLEKFTGNGFETEVVGKVSYSVQGNVMTVCIPKTMLGIPTGDADFEFSFKWTDNTCEDGDIMKWYVNGDTAPVGRWNYCYTTKGSEKHNPENANHGNSYLDLTDEETQEMIKEYMLLTAENMTYEFTSDGLVLTSTDKGSKSDFVLNFANASPRVALDNYTYIEVTYKVVDGTTDSLRLSFGGGLSYPTAQNSRTKTLTLTADGEVHTVSAKISQLLVTKGYLSQLGIYFGRTAPTGCNVIISSIRFVE